MNPHDETGTKMQTNKPDFCKALLGCVTKWHCCRLGHCALYPPSQTEQEVKPCATQQEGQSLKSTQTSVASNAEQESNPPASATPRTDAKLLGLELAKISVAADSEWAEFAGELERELAEAKETLFNAQQALLSNGMSANATIARLEKERDIRMNLELGEITTLKKQLAAALRERDGLAAFINDHCRITATDPRMDVVKDCIKERDSLQQQVAMLRESLKSFIRPDGHNVGCTFDRSGESPDSDFCTCRKSVAVALSSTPSTPVVSWEEVRTVLSATIDSIERALPNTGAWENRCPFCGCDTPVGDLRHRTGCVVLELPSLRNLRDKLTER